MSISHVKMGEVLVCKKMFISFLQICEIVNKQLLKWMEGIIITV
jgi:hypothetical protein